MKKTHPLPVGCLCAVLMVGISLIAPFRTARAELDFATGIPEFQTRQIKRDLERFLQLSPGLRVHSDTLELFGVTGPEHLANFIDERLSIVLPETFEIQRAQIHIEASPHNYPQPTAIPHTQRPPQASPVRPPGASAPVVVMANVGSGIYLAGKQRKELLALEIPGVGKTVVRSPRVGIALIGSGLFRTRAGGRERTLDSYPLFAARIETLFHEARHSDGNGLSTGFRHAYCPTDHDYAGFAACDTPDNGPYTIGALILAALANACDTCSRSDLEMMKIILLDLQNRRLHSSETPTLWDPTPEGA